LMRCAAAVRGVGEPLYLRFASSFLVFAREIRGKSICGFSFIQVLRADKCGVVYGTPSAVHTVATRAATLGKCMCTQRDVRQVYPYVREGTCSISFSHLPTMCTKAFSSKGTTDIGEPKLPS
jgi:hypothetical protein